MPTKVDRNVGQLSVEMLDDVVISEVQKWPDIKATGVNDLLMQKKLKEELGCDVECVAAIGRATQADKLLGMYIARQDEQWLVAAKLIDVARVSIVCRSVERINGDAAHLFAAIPDLIANLCKKKTEPAAPTERVVVRNQHQGVIIIPFARASLHLSADQNEQLNEVVAVALQNDIVLRVEGHTDSRGSAEYNRRLSIERAEAVAEYLVARGVSRQRIEVEGFGESRPIASNRDAAGRAKNSRVEIRVK